MINVMLVDDQNLVRKGVRSLLELSEEIEVVAEAADGAEAIRMIPEVEPDVVLLDMRMPGLSGLDVLRELSGREALPPTIARPETPLALSSRPSAPRAEAPRPQPLPPTIALTPELGGCVSWVDLGRDLPEAPAEAAAAEPEADAAEEEAAAEDEKDADDEAPKA